MKSDSQNLAHYSCEKNDAIALSAVQGGGEIATERGCGRTEGSAGGEKNGK